MYIHVGENTLNQRSQDKMSVFVYKTIKSVSTKVTRINIYPQKIFLGIYCILLGGKNQFIIIKQTIDN